MFKTEYKLKTEQEYMDKILLLNEMIVDAREQWDDLYAQWDELHKVGELIPLGHADMEKLNDMEDQLEILMKQRTHLGSTVLGISWAIGLISEQELVMLDVDGLLKRVRKERSEE